MFFLPKPLPRNFRNLLASASASWRQHVPRNLLVMASWQCLWSRHTPRNLLALASSSEELQMAEPLVFGLLLVPLVFIFSFLFFWLYLLCLFYFLFVIDFFVLFCLKMSPKTCVGDNMQECNESPWRQYHLLQIVMLNIERPAPIEQWNSLNQNQMLEAHSCLLKIVMTSIKRAHTRVATEPWGEQALEALEPIWLRIGGVWASFCSF